MNISYGTAGIGRYSSCQNAPELVHLNIAFFIL